jgi:hypothetical protein
MWSLCKNPRIYNCHLYIIYDLNAFNSLYIPHNCVKVRVLKIYNYDSDCHGNVTVTAWEPYHHDSDCHSMLQLQSRNLIIMTVTVTAYVKVTVSEPYHHDGDCHRICYSNSLGTLSS